MKYGYARVSSDTQDYAAQVEALKAAGGEHIHSEKTSGKSTNGRPELAKLLARRCRDGDQARPRRPVGARSPEHQVVSRSFRTFSFG